MAGRTVDIKENIDMRHDYDNLKPLGSFVLMEVVKRKEMKTEGGIIVPDTQNEMNPYLKVLAVGPNVEAKDIEPGDVVEPDGDSGRITYFLGKNWEQYGLIDIKHIAGVFKKHRGA